MNYENTPPLGRPENISRATKRGLLGVTLEPRCSKAYYYFVNTCAAAFILAYVITFTLEDWSIYKVDCPAVNGTMVLFESPSAVFARNKTSGQMTYHFDLWKVRVSGCCCQTLPNEPLSGTCCSDCSRDESYGSCDDEFCSSGLSVGAVITLFSLLIVIIGVVNIGLQTMGTRLPYSQERVHYCIVALWALVSLLSLLCYILWMASPHEDMKSYITSCSKVHYKEEDGSYRVSFLSFFLSMGLAILCAFRDKDFRADYLDIEDEMRRELDINDVEIPLEKMGDEGESYQSLGDKTR